MVQYPAETPASSSFNAPYDAPLLSVQKDDTSRVNMCTYELYRDNQGGPAASVTEHEGLQGLYEYLDTAASDEGLDQRLAENAATIRDNLALICRKEYENAVGGIAQDLRTYLDEDQDRQLAVITHSPGRAEINSGDYVLEGVLRAFGDTLPRYRGRLTTSLERFDMQKPHDLGRVVLLDDLVVSGSQIRGLYKYAASRGVADMTEIQLITASKDRITQGLEPSFSYQEYIPLKAYYQAPNVSLDKTGLQERGIVSGTHSSTDYAYDEAIDHIAKARNPHDPQMPPLTNIVRPYRSHPRWRSAFKTNRRGQVVQRRVGRLAP